jgi:5-(aminomethyl)-3-furanmethanol phosphate kinase
MSKGEAPVVVKIGGSLAFSHNLQRWLAACVACAGRVVIVPGGGPFADTVRSAQARMQFDDLAAHQMAVLAMEQYGRALASRNALLALADTVDAIRHCLARQHVPVWSPARMVFDARDIAPSWDVTSDSLAAWLSASIGAVRLLVVKSVALASRRERCESLVATGILDKAFPRYLQSGAIRCSILGPEDHSAAMAAIRDGTPVGLSIE